MVATDDIAAAEPTFVLFHIAPPYTFQWAMGRHVPPKYSTGYLFPWAHGSPSTTSFQGPREPAAKWQRDRLSSFCRARGRD